jgi:hypothetical protein
MKKLLIGFIIFFQLTILFAEEKPLRHGLGFAVGMLSGSGFSYRQINQKYGFQVTFGLLSYNNSSSDFSESYRTSGFGPDMDRTFTEEKYGRETNGNIGLMIYRILNRSNRSLFYGMIGLGNYFSDQVINKREYKYNYIESNTYLYEPVGPITKDHKRDLTTNIGLGFGLEWSWTNNIHMIIEWPLIVTNDLDIYMYIPQAGIHYYFK